MTFFSSRDGQAQSDEASPTEFRRVRIDTERHDSEEQGLRKDSIDHMEG